MLNVAAHSVIFDYRTSRIAVIYDYHLRDSVSFRYHTIKKICNLVCLIEFISLFTLLHLLVQSRVLKCGETSCSIESSNG